MMAKSPDHFRWTDLRPALLQNGWASRVVEIELFERQIRELYEQRRDLCNEYLSDVIFNHQNKVCEFAFRPCHARKLDTLSVSTSLWLE